MSDLVKQHVRKGLPDEALFKRLGWACDKYREYIWDTSVQRGLKPVPWLLAEIRQLLGLSPDSLFARGIRSLGIETLSDEAQATFYCLCSLFLEQPLEPMDESYFQNDDARNAFGEGIETLLGRRLVITVAINKSDESRATKDNYMVSPEVCRVLFRGREGLIRPSVMSQFGNILPWKDIRPVSLYFPEGLQECLHLITRAVSVEQYERVAKELERHGFRAGVSALLYGPPGTGKTEFVRQLALTTGRNLFMVDGAKLGATYFGEKPRNMRDFFRLAKFLWAVSTQVPIIFIDEADGLLGTRVDVNRSSDREENLSTNIILEEMNSFAGILLASTNHLQNIDPAMKRRFLIKAEFPVPDRSVLARIWQSKLPWLSAADAEVLAARFPLSGGIVDNVVSMCLLEKIVNGTGPSLDRILRHCIEQGEQGRPSPIGFR